jgi:trk system potassium uptake protein
VSFLRARHPSQLVVAGFAAAILVGTALLALPVSRAGDGGASILAALFTSTSAVTVTGLVVVDTPTYWSPFGHAVLAALIQIGGFGIMAMTSLLALIVVRRLGLRTRLLAQFETGALQLGDVRQVLLGVASLTLAFEVLATGLITARLWISYDYPFGTALWHGVFHAVSAFNNAGFALYSDSLVRFVSDAWIVLTVCLALVAGGLGFPVWLELRRLWRFPRRWSLHTKITLTATAALIVAGIGAVLASEWDNEETLGGLPLHGKLLAGVFQGVAPRTAGFNTVDYAAVEPETLLVTDMLMFVGGGSAATTGGIKVTTFAVLLLMAIAEFRGDPHVTAFRRRIPGHAQRQALAIAFAAANAVVLGTLALMTVSELRLGPALFEVMSAFGTVGLSTGITAELAPAGQAILIALMFLGRVGPHTLGVALVLRERPRLHSLPEERPLIG